MKLRNITLQEALDSGLPFKCNFHKWWFDPKLIPEFLKKYAKDDWRGKTWMTTSFEVLEEQNRETDDWTKENISIGQPLIRTNWGGVK